MAKHKLFIAEIKRKVFILVPIDDDPDDAAYRLAEGMTMPDPNDPEMEYVGDFEEAVINANETSHFNRVPMSETGNTRTIRQLIDSGDLEFKK